MVDALPPLDRQLMRFLTDAEKQGHLEYWCKVRADFSANPPACDPAGMGYPDRETYELTDRLNALEGVCTVQSCSGHRVGARNVVNGEPAESLWCAQLWLRLSEPLFWAFIRNAEHLAARKPHIERVNFLFDPWEGVADLQFQGLNVGADALEESGQVVDDFFRTLVKLAD